MNSETEVLLIPITNEEYNEWIVTSIETYKDEHVKNGSTQSEARKKADDDFQKLLPFGLASKDNFIFAIRAHSSWVGTLWFGIRGAEDNRKAFIYDIGLNEASRGLGIGKKVMSLLEIEVKKLGLSSIGLHVFGHNTVARALYEKMGYGITNLVLEKKLLL